MPSKPDLSKARVRWSGATVNPDLYAKVGGVAVRLDPDPSSSVEIALPRGAVNGFGQAADLYDTVGVNVHFLNGTAYPVASSMTDLAALGVRHVRDGAHASWYHSNFQNFRPWTIALRNRINALPSKSSTDMGQPIFLHANTSKWPGQMTSGQFGTPNQGGPFNRAYTADDFIKQWVGGHQHYDGNASPSAALPGVGNPIPNGTTSNQNAAIPNPWNTNEPEHDSTILSALAGPNEPSAFNGVYSQIKPWLTSINQLAAAQTRTVLGGLPYVTASGIQTGPAKFSQLPIHGVLKYGGNLSDYGNMGAGTGTCDTGDFHPYHVGHEPSQEYLNRILNNDPDPHPGLPKMLTEWGHISTGVANLGTPSAASPYNNGSGVFVSPGFHAGYWPAPDDVIAEFVVRTILVFYKRGIRRHFYYEFCDEGTNAQQAEENFGMIRLSGRVRKEQFYAMRNLLDLIGFSEAPTGQKGAVAYGITGFASSGQNNHIAMFQGQGDPGAVGIGGTYHTNTDILDPVLLQQSANQYVLCVPRCVKIWDREPGNWNTTTNRPQNLVNVAAGRSTPNTQTITVNFPGGISEAREATPTAGGNTTPDDGRTWGAAKTISGGTSFTAQISGKTKLFRIIV